MKRGMRRMWGGLPAALMMAVLALVLASCGTSEKKKTKHYYSSRAYAGHENDTDIYNFVNVYPNVIGKRLDDCQTCHRSATLKCGNPKKATLKTTCDYCHQAQPQYADTTCVAGDTADPVPKTIVDTLNPYGISYFNAGRDQKALKAIDGVDSDRDTYPNGVEIADLRFPGDPNSNPGLPYCPVIFLTKSEIESITPTHSHLQLDNTSRQQFDDYAYWTGVKAQDFLNWLHTNKSVDLSTVTSLTFIAPDGFTKTYNIVPNVNAPAKAGILKLGLDVATLGTTCGFVNYPPASYLTGLSDGATLGISNGNEQWLTIAYQKNGADLEKAYYDATDGTLQGEGPYRLVVPQFTTPGAPDRGSSWSGIAACSSTAAYDYNGSADHNAGSMVRGLTVIRLDPAPTTCEQFDWKNGGFAYIDDSEIVIFGDGVQ